MDVVDGVLLGHVLVALRSTVSVSASKFPVPLSSWFEGGNVGVTLNGNLNLE